ncbi:sulfate ABC transporter substrate-binding protein, partial [Streptomyces sp. NPDC055813]
MPATAPLRRAVAVLAALPLLSLAACGYGSQAEKDDGAKVAAGAEKTDGLDSVRIG